MALHPETLIQIAVIRHCDIMAVCDDRYKWIYHAKNENARDARQGALYKQMGVRKGVSDIHVPYPANGKHGLWIELKDGVKKLSKEQVLFLAEMEHRGYATAQAGSAREAIDIIDEYIRGK